MGGGGREHKHYFTCTGAQMTPYVNRDFLPLPTLLGNVRLWKTQVFVPLGSCTPATGPRRMPSLGLGSARTYSLSVSQAACGL